MFFTTISALTRPNLTCRKLRAIRSGGLARARKDLTLGTLVTKFEGGISGLSVNDERALVDATMVRSMTAVHTAIILFADESSLNI